MKTEKVSIVCKHLVKGGEDKYYLVKSKPIDIRDSGEVVSCKRCFETENINIDDYITICTHCLKKILKNKKELKIN